MSDQRAVTKDLVHRYFNDLLNRGDLSAVDHIMSEEITFSYPLGVLTGRQAVKEYITVFRTAFPDVVFEVFDLIEEEGRAAARWTFKGTQSGPFRDQPPSHKAVEVSGVTFFQSDNGQLSHLWIRFDPAPLLGS